MHRRVMSQYSDNMFYFAIFDIFVFITISFLLNIYNDNIRFCFIVLGLFVYCFSLSDKLVFINSDYSRFKIFKLKFKRKLGII